MVTNNVNRKGNIMMYLLIGIIVTLLLMTPYGDELRRGYDAFVDWFHLKVCHGNAQEAEKFQKEQQDKADKWINKHLGDEGSQKRFTGATLIMILIWPIFIGGYLLSFVLHT